MAKRIQAGKSSRARKPHGAAVRRRTDVTTFLGFALVRDAGRGRIETLIVSDLKAAKYMDLAPAELDLAKQVLAGGVRKCKGQSQGGQVRCANLGGCGHKCHLFRQRLPIPVGGPNPEDLGENDRQ